MTSKDFQFVLGFIFIIIGILGLTVLPPVLSSIDAKVTGRSGPYFHWSGDGSSNNYHSLKGENGEKYTISDNSASSKDLLYLPTGTNVTLHLVFNIWFGWELKK